MQPAWASLRFLAQLIREARRFWLFCLGGTEAKDRPVLHMIYCILKLQVVSGKSQSLSSSSCPAFMSSAMCGAMGVACFGAGRVRRCS